MQPMTADIDEGARRSETAALTPGANLLIANPDGE